jgi:hypothetical protein
LGKGRGGHQTKDKCDTQSIHFPVSIFSTEPISSVIHAANRGGAQE